MEDYKGLSFDEVLNSSKKHGTNRLTEKFGLTFWQRYWLNFNDPITLILLGALGFNILFTFLGKVDWFECVGILTAVLISTFVSTISEHKNENTFKNLQNQALKIFCKVYRDGKLGEVLIDDIVVGDIVLLQMGDMIPADGCVISGKIRVDQSSLNGESKEVEKAGSEKETNFSSNHMDFWGKTCVYRGSVVCFGQCVMRVEKVGDETLYGKLSLEAQESDPESPLSIQLKKLAKDISRFGYVGAFLIFAIFLFQKILVNNSFDSVLIGRYFMDTSQVLSDIIEGVIMGITVIVVAVPEGLPLMIAIVCSLNMRKMLKSKVLVRKVIGIETAGSINVLFTDKTGTLTEGKLSVTGFFDGKGRIFENYEDIPLTVRKMFYISAVGNTAAKFSDEKIIGGNGTEKALLNFVAKDREKWEIATEKEFPFSSENKYSMAKIKGDYSGVLIKGAPEKILKNCGKFYDEDGCLKEFNNIRIIEDKIKESAEKSSRVIAFALANEKAEEKLPENMIFLGLAIIKDEIRSDVKLSVGEVQRAGIHVVMVTGDRKETAVAIGKECGIITKKDDLILTSDELKMMCDSELRQKLLQIKVVARALPQDKSRLVKVAQSCGMVVGMTGDGVNDSPALKGADVGFAMGSGTEVAKEAGDIVIMDNSFSSIKRAVLYGRTIYKSIKKFIAFQLSLNVAAVSVSLAGLFAGMEKPLSIIQMLWINLIMDTLAAIAFGGEPALKKYMLERPKKREEAILDKKMWSSVLTQGFFICALSLIMLASSDIRSIFTNDLQNLHFYTGYFSFFVFAGIFNAFNVRADGIDLLENLAANKQFVIVMAAISVIQILMTHFGGVFLRTVDLGYREWLAVIALSFLIVPVDILRKIITKT